MFKLAALTIVTVLTALLAGSTNAASLSSRGPPLIANIVYDDSLCTASRSLNTVACSTGANGLITKGYSTLSSLPSFPAVGAFPGVGFNSPNCGGCYEIWYSGTGRSQYFTAVTDSGSSNQAVLCTSEFLALTGFTRDNVPANVEVEIRGVPAYDCGFN
ncbi:hypothetical protein MD484_g2465, partial [Candolleomyces efflorescens]